MTTVEIPTLEELQRLLVPNSISWARGEHPPLHLGRRREPTLPAPPDPSWGTPLGQSIYDDMLRILNAFRVDHGVQPLVFDARLQACSLWKTMNCSGFQYMAHDTADPAWPGGRTVVDRFATYYPTGAWGENIAYGMLTPEDAFSAWISAGPGEGHYDNIVSSSWVSCGLSGTRAANGLIFWEQCFGSEPPVKPPDPNDHTPPTVPTGLTVDGVTPTTVNFHWKASTDAGSGVKEYRVTENGALLGSTGVVSCTVGGLTSGQTYLIGVSAVDYNGNVSGETTVKVTAGGSPPPPPPPPPDTPDPRVGETWENRLHPATKVRVMALPTGHVTRAVIHKDGSLGLSVTQRLSVFKATYRPV